MRDQSAAEIPFEISDSPPRKRDFGEISDSAIKTNCFCQVLGQFLVNFVLNKYGQDWVKIFKDSTTSYPNQYIILKG